MVTLTRWPSSSTKQQPLMLMVKPSTFQPPRSLMFSSSTENISAFSSSLTMASTTISQRVESAMLSRLQMTMSTLKLASNSLAQRKLKRQWTSIFRLPSSQTCSFTTRSITIWNPVSSRSRYQQISDMVAVKQSIKT